MTNETLMNNPVRLFSWEGGEKVWRTWYFVDKTDTHVRTEKFDFGLVDNRGRAIGYVVRYFRCEQAPLPDGSDRGDISLAEDLGDSFAAHTNPTRDGERYGASSADLRARTLRELEALVAKRMAAARKRYVAKLMAAARKRHDRQ